MRDQWSSQGLSNTKSMAVSTFIETYEIDPSVCDEIVEFFERNRDHAQPGRLGEHPRVDKAMKDSLDITISIKSYGQFEAFFDCLIEHVKTYLQTYYYSTGADGLGALWFSQHANICLLYTSPSPRDKRQSRMPSSA